jgi:NAD(P)H-dependent FMN reductase
MAYRLDGKRANFCTTRRAHVSHRALLLETLNGDHFPAKNIMKILAISGSLRAGSHNSAMLRAAKRLAPPDIAVEVFSGIGDLPLFNPDVEASDPAPVARLRNSVVAADAVLIASPEYAHGITGAMKNALDWLVGCEAFVFKPVVLLNASPRATHAQAALREVLSVMSAQIVDEASITVPIIGSGLDENGIVEHPEIAVVLQGALAALRDRLKQP